MPGTLNLDKNCPPPFFDFSSKGFSVFWKFVIFSKKVLTAALIADINPMN